jgi:mono/diheme cytochrome c family protein
MKRINMFVFTIAALALVAMIAAPAISRADAAHPGQATYDSKCASCHGKNGVPSAMGAKMGAKDFGSADVQKQTDAQLTSAIKDGKGKMPKYAGKLSDDDIKNLVSYIRTFKK